MKHHAPRQRVLILHPSMVSDPSQGGSRTVDWRQWTDWVALGCYAALGIALWWHSAGIGLMVLPIILHQLLIESTGARAASERGSRALSHLSSLVPLALLVIAGNMRPEWLVTTRDRALLTAGQAVWATGCVLGFASLKRMYRAASLQDPSLITERPAIYHAYALTLAGLWLCHPTLPFAALLAVWLVTLALWNRHEAQATRATAQELGAWRSQVDALGARLASLTVVPGGTGREDGSRAASPLLLPARASQPVVPAGPDAQGATPAGQQHLVTDHNHNEQHVCENGHGVLSPQPNGHGPAQVGSRTPRRRMRRPRIDRIIPGLGRLSVTPMVRCSPSCTLEVTSGGRRRRRHATSCEVARRSQTIDRLVERGQLEILRAIKTGALTLDEVHAREVGSRHSAA